MQIELATQDLAMEPAAQLIAIFVAPARHVSQIEVNAAQLKAGKGIVGDRFFGLRKTRPGLNLSLIESEAIEAFNRAYQTDITMGATRRNLVTRHLRLNDLVGKTFVIGDVLCRGVELCEPCQVMVRQFPVTAVSRAELIRFFHYRGGIRAEILSDGIVQAGDCIREINQPS